MRRIIFGILALTLFAIAVQNVSAEYTTCDGCHPKYAAAIKAKMHDNTDNCIICHKGSYDLSTHTASGTYIGYVVNETTCKGTNCHSTTSGFAQRPVNESHGNHYYGQNKADCTQCHFANTTRLFSLNISNSLYEHDHNFTVEYNYYNYNISGMPLESDHSASKKGMFPYYTCTLTCHGTYKVEEEVIGWEESAHARSNHNSGDNNSYCAKCKSPTNYNLSATYSTRFSYNITDANWQGIQCRVCHNLHNDTYSGNGTSPVYYAFYNTTATLQTGSVVYDQTPNATVLCEKCHEPNGGSHDSKFAGTHKDTYNFTCVSCHANSTFNNLTHKFEVKNTTSGVIGCEICHNSVDHTFKFTSLHEDEVTCEACHDQTFTTVNSTGFAVSSNNYFGLWKATPTSAWTTAKKMTSSPANWSLHNISRSVDCNKCHGALSVFNGTIAPSFGNSTGCDACHSSYVTAVNSTIHNQTLTIGAPGCTYCHSGYENVANHTTGNRSFIVNESNTCRNCHVEGNNLNESHGNHGYGQNYADCTQCHFANTTQVFNATASTFTHDHNLTVEYNFYNYNISGIPLSTNGGVGKGMFPYYTCTLTCHNGTGGGQPKIENETIAWNQSGHGQVPYTISNSANWSNATCLRCKSPMNFNSSLSRYKIAESDWQGIQCRICHNLHNNTYSGNGTPPIGIAYYNMTLSNSTGSPVYNTVANNTELCNKCHTGYHTTSRDIYYSGFHKTSLGFTCADCHMNSTINNGSTHTFDVSNTTSGLTGCEACHVATSVHLANFSQYWVHDNIVTCQACHDASFVLNSSNYVVSTTIVSGGIYKNATNIWVTHRGTTSVTEWDFHNITKNVTCEKCHGGFSAKSGVMIAPALSGETGCAQCHPSYVSAVNSSMHNQTRNSAAPNCTQCHTGYDNTHTGYVVNETNSCRNCHNATSSISRVNESHGNHNYGQNYSDCTQCHFANTTQQFSLNTSLSTHDHNLTIEYNYYNYNLYGMPLSTNGGVGKGMFPYYSCTLTCHNGTGGGQPMIENETIAWNQSKHAKATRGSTYNNSCTKCHSPPVYNESNFATIATGDKQGIQCRVCHNLHNDTYSGNGTPPINVAFYNATLSSSAGSPVYNTVANSTELCEKCHAGGYHATSRDIYYNGSHKTSLGFTCIDCHMNSTINNGSEHSFDVENSTSGFTGCEACHVATSEHTTSNFREYSSHLNVTCDACHDGTFVRNSTDYVVNVSTGRVAGGIYKNTITNKWTTYRGNGTPTATDWTFHNISKNISCDKCHGALSVKSGAIAPNLTSGGTTYYTTDALIVGYNYIVPWLYPEPTIYANYLINSSLSGVTGVNKTLNWNSTSQDWEGYEYIGGVYIGTNFTVVGKKPYFVNSVSDGNKYTFRGTK